MIYRPLASGLVQPEEKKRLCCCDCCDCCDGRRIKRREGGREEVNGVTDRGYPVLNNHFAHMYHSLATAYMYIDPVSECIPNLAINGLQERKKERKKNVLINAGLID